MLGYAVVRPKFLMSTTGLILLTRKKQKSSPLKGVSIILKIKMGLLALVLLAILIIALMQLLVILMEEIPNQRKRSPIKDTSIQRENPLQKSLMVSKIGGARNLESGQITKP